MTALMCCASAAVAILAGWLTDDGPVLILGFWLLLVGFACLLERDYSRNRAVLYDDERTL